MFRQWKLNAFDIRIPSPVRRTPADKRELLYLVVR